MSRKPSFANLRDRSVAVPAPAPTIDTAPADATGGGATPRPTSREGRKQIAGFFSPDMSAGRLASHCIDAIETSGARYW